MLQRFAVFIRATLVAAAHPLLLRFFLLLRPSHFLCAVLIRARASVLKGALAHHPEIRAGHLI
jgi:hypothetical protein